MSKSVNSEPNFGSPEYLLTIERRLMRLESQIETTIGERDQVKETVDEQRQLLRKLQNSVEDIESKQSDFSTRLWKVIDSGRSLTSNLFSDNFLERAFAVWGHYFTAQIIIGITIFLIVLVVGYL